MNFMHFVLIKMGNIACTSLTSCQLCVKRQSELDVEHLPSHSNNNLSSTAVSMIPNGQKDIPRGIKIKTLSSKCVFRLEPCEKTLIKKNETSKERISKSSDALPQINVNKLYQKNIRRGNATQVGFMDEVIKGKQTKLNSNVILVDAIEEVDESQKDFSDRSVSQNDFSFIDEEIEKEDEEQIRKVLKEHFILNDLTEDMIRVVLHDLILFRIEKGKVLYEEGNEANYMYIIAEGEVEMKSVSSSITKVFKAWETFGELPLLTKCRRTESTKSLTHVKVFLLDGNSFRQIQNEMSSVRLKERFDFLNLIPFCKALDNVYRHNIAERMKLIEFKPSEKIISIGEAGNKLYMIKEGMVSCRSGCTEIRKLARNEYFGQNSILIDTKRTLDVIAIQHTIVYQIDKNDLIDSIGMEFKNIILFSLFKECVEQDEYFKEIVSSSQMEGLFKQFILKVYGNGDIVVDGNANDKKMIVIIEGAIMKASNYEVIGTKGRIIGKEYFITYSPPSEKLLAYPDCISLEASIDDIIKLLNIEISFKSSTFINKVNRLKHCFIFKNLSDNTLCTISNKLTKKKFEQGTYIIKENTTSDEMYLITKGRVHVIQDGRIIREQAAGSFFGEMSILKEGDKRTASVLAIEKVVCYALNREAFKEVIGDGIMQQFLKKKLYLQETRTELSDLTFLKLLGKGKFGTVYLVKHKNGNVYAIKSLRKKMVEDDKVIVKYVMQEKRIMLSLDHPFIIKMVKTLKNSTHCLFLLEFINGENFDEYLRRRTVTRIFDETQFYFGCLIIMIEYLHNRNIAHRDIKPMNIMLDENGYLKLIDFGTAKVIENFTNTNIGTPHYLAPEVIQGKGYSLSCDYWSIGVCLFEIFYGMSPFGHLSNNFLEIYKEILNKELVLPPDSHKKYHHVNTLIKALLTKKVNRRVCSVSKIKSFDFFKSFDWDGLMDFKLKPKYQPDVIDLDKYGNNSTLPSFEKALASENDLSKDRPVIKSFFSSDFYNNWAEEF